MSTGVKSKEPHRGHDMHRALVGPPLCSEEQHDAAWEVIKSYAASGLLPPVSGVEGDLAQTYADILGIRHD